MDVNKYFIILSALYLLTIATLTNLIFTAYASTCHICNMQWLDRIPLYRLCKPLVRKAY